MIETQISKKSSSFLGASTKSERTKLFSSLWLNIIALDDTIIHTQIDGFQKLNYNAPNANKAQRSESHKYSNDNYNICCETFR